MTRRLRPAGRRAGPFPLKCVLVACDLSPAAENAAWRGAHLARGQRAWVRLVHFLPAGQHPAAAQRALDALAWRLRQQLQVAVLAQVVAAAPHEELARCADATSLVVMAAPLDAGPLARRWHAWQAIRVVRRHALPLLVARRPAASACVQVLAGVPRGPHGPGCLAAAVGMAGGPHVELLPALQRLAGEAARVPAGQRDRELEARLVALAQATSRARMQEAPCVVHAPSAAQLLAQENELHPDLVVVAEALRPGDAKDAPRAACTVLAEARADVLVLPLATAGAGQGAPRRIARDGRERFSAA